MKILIVGAGTVGVSLAEHLSRQEHQIAVIDRDADTCEELSGRLDVLTVTGGGTTPGTLEAAGVRSADMIVAVTKDDDTNIVVCALAAQYGVPKRIARIGNPEYTDDSNPVNLAKLGVTEVIEPEKEMVRTVLNYIDLPGVTEAANFHNDSVCLRGYRITADMPIANRQILEINELHEGSMILIVLIIRHNMSIIPKGSEMVLPDDEIVAIMAPDALEAFAGLVNQSGGKARKVIVYGDSLTAAELARSLIGRAERVMLVDPNEAHGQEVAARTSNKVEILHGDCTSVELLQEIHIESASFFVAASTDPEDNIMACLLAKAEGAREVIAIGSAGRHAKLFGSLGLDRLITPHDITLRSIIGSVLKIPIGALLKVRNADVEVTRLVVGPKSRTAGKPVRAIPSLHTEPFVIGSVFRDEQVIIPSGETVLQAGDEMLVVTQSEGSAAVRRVFEGGFLNLPL